MGYNSYQKKPTGYLHGQIPHTVRLLAFDTTEDQAESAAKAYTKGNNDEELHPQLGQVALDKNSEFIYLGGDIYDICRSIADTDGRDYPHIAQWLQADYYLNVLNRNDFSLKYGAGMRRQFGRMSVFLDMIGATKVYNAINQAIQEVTRATDNIGRLNICLLSSIVGGTGNGMLLDIAHITCQVAKQYKDKDSFSMLGFVVMQNAFSKAITTSYDRTLSNVYAGVRELDRFMLNADHDYPIYYVDDRRRKNPISVYRGTYREKLFDVCFLLDAKREHYSLDGFDPRIGIYPAIADAVTTLFDGETGQNFFQHSKNVSFQLSRMQEEKGEAFYSSLGIFTYILPVKEMIATASYRMSRDLFEKYLFSCIIDPLSRKEIWGYSNVSWVNSSPRDEMLAFLKADLVGSTQNIKINGQIGLEVVKNLADANYIQDMAWWGLGFLPWLEPVEQNQIVNQCYESIKAVLETPMSSLVQSGRQAGDGPFEAADRISEEIRARRMERLGYDDGSGQHIAGELEIKLREFARLNEARFRKLLAEKVMLLLNGDETFDQAAIRRAGRLPYTQAFLKYLIMAYDEFTIFIEQIREYRTNSGELKMAEDSANRAKQIMYNNRDPRALDLMKKLSKVWVQAQEQYIQSEDYLYELQRQEVIYRELEDRVKRLRAITHEMKNWVDRWIAVLLGDTNHTEYGTYPRLKRMQASHEAQRNQDWELRVHAYVTDVSYENRKYDELITDRVWNQLMADLNWNVVDDDRQFHLGLTLGSQPLHVEDWDEDPAGALNASIIMNRLGSYFKPYQELRVIDRLQEMYRDPRRLTRDMLDKAEALISFVSYNVKSNRHNFVCINASTNHRYETEIATALVYQSQEAAEANQVIGLTNPYRAIVLSTVGAISSDSMHPVKTARDAYLSYSGNRSELHAFPAEVHASWYESRLANQPIQQPVRLLSSRIVPLLEDLEMMRLFTLALAYEIIQPERIEDKSHYVLRVDRIDEYDQTSVIYLTKNANHDLDGA